ncbi:MAG: MotA/TolQ/ExbB proton channel family protein [Deltaproteobacteria bacterium]|nr:MotA/TolQ/ExbB proton channel family protein [Deltaproteobacteria bacterium]
MKRLYCFLFTLFVVWLCGQNSALTQQGQEKPDIGSLDSLLKRVEKGWKVEEEDNRKREATFAASKEKQKQILAEAEAVEEQATRESEVLELKYEENENRLSELEQTLKNRLGNKAELFGVVRQTAGNIRTLIQNSMVSARLPDRDAFLGELAESKKLPSKEQLEKLWFVMQQQAVESGKVIRFNAPVIIGGQKIEKEVTQVGVFNSISGGKFLEWKNGNLFELQRQPAERYLSTAQALEAAPSGGLVRFAVDPSQGSILSLLVSTPDFGERIDQGGIIGYIIIILGLAGLAFGLLRLIYILFIGWKVQIQQRHPDRIKEDNPLGRVMAIPRKTRVIQGEELETQLDATILRESSNLERFLWAIKVISVVAPLLGLLGTVVGMIQTFQAITLFGTGDPKMMAEGISQALVTTMLGLYVAVPLVLLHSWLTSICRRIGDILNEQSAGIIALFSPGAAKE